MRSGSEGPLNKRSPWWQRVFGWLWAQAAGARANGGVAGATAAESSAAIVCSSESKSTGVGPEPCQHSGGESRASLAHGDPKLVFDERHQSTDLEAIRAQFLESIELARESPPDRFYERMFSDANFGAFHSGLSQAINLARARQALDPGQEDLMRVMTGAGLLVCVSWDHRLSVLHVSLENQIRPTTHAVCSHFVQFTFAMIGENDVKLAGTPYFTDSGVHHVVLHVRPDLELKIRDFKTSLAIAKARYQSMPFEYASPEYLAAIAKVGCIELN